MTRNILNRSGIIRNDIEDIKIVAGITNNTLVFLQLMQAEIAMIILHAFLSQIKGLTWI